MFSKNWEKIYKNRKQISIWPWSDLISMTMQNKKRIKNFPNSRVLELGFGSGANINFFTNLGMNYFGFEGSKHIVSIVRRKYPKIKNKLFNKDFTKPYSFKKKFDLVVDRGSITHNNFEGIKNAIFFIEKNIKKNGLLICTDLFSTKSSEFKKGQKGDEQYTKKNYKDGQFKNIGNVHFFKKRDFPQIFTRWKILFLSEKKITTILPKKNNNIATWQLVAQKK